MKTKWIMKRKALLKVVLFEQRKISQMIENNRPIGDITYQFNMAKRAEKNFVLNR